MKTSTGNRTIQLNIRLTAQEKEKLETLAGAYGLSQTSMIIMLINQEFIRYSREEQS